MLYNGEEVGDGHGPAVDVAVDPLEGTRLTAKGQPNAIAVIALAERGTMFFPGAAVYMDKIATGPEAIDAVDIDAPPRENIERVARAKGMRPSEVSVVVLERDRHEALIDELRETGCKVHLIPDGDVAPAIAAAQPQTGVDLLMGIGGTPEGVIAAAALKCVGGGVQGKLWPRNDEERSDARQRRLRPRPRADDGRPRLGRGRLRGGDRRDHRRAAARRPLPVGRGGHGLDRHALPLGHGAPRRGDARARQARALHRARVPLRLRRARIGVAAAFAVHAAVAGSFSSRLPALKHGLGIGDGRVGLALFVMAVATLIGTRVAPLAVRRDGQSRPGSRRDGAPLHRTRRARGRFVVRVVLREPRNARWARWPARRRLQRPGDRRPAGVRPAAPFRAPRRLERRALRGRGTGRSSSCGGAFARLAVQPRRGRARARKCAVARVAAAAGRRAAGSSRGVRPAADADARTRRDRLCRLRGRGSGRGLERDLRARQSRRGGRRRRRGGRGVRGCDGGGALHRRPGDVALRPGPPRRGGRRCRGDRLRAGRRGAAPGSGVLPGSRSSASAWRRLCPSHSALPAHRARSAGW